MSCLFNSLSYFLNLENKVIRNMICDYLQENKPIIEGIATHDILKYEKEDINKYINNIHLGRD